MVLNMTDWQMAANIWNIYWATTSESTAFKLYVTLSLNGKHLPVVSLAVCWVCPTCGASSWAACSGSGWLACPSRRATATSGTPRPYGSSEGKRTEGITDSPQVHRQHKWQKRCWCEDMQNCMKVHWPMDADRNMKNATVKVVFQQQPI